MRDLLAHVLQLCHYVEDMRCEPGVLKTYDYTVLRAKAEQVKKMIDDQLVNTYSPL